MWRISTVKGVVGGDCTGFTHDLYFEDAVGEMDEEFELRGVKLYIDPLSLQYLENVEIDFTEGLHGSVVQVPQPQRQGELRLWLVGELLT
jgi:iron-sulfur cluster insertion protein